MNVFIDEVLQHLDFSLPAEFDYSNVNTSLDFLFRKSFNGKEISIFYQRFCYFIIYNLYHTEILCFFFFFLLSEISKY